MDLGTLIGVVLGGATATALAVLGGGLVLLVVIRWIRHERWIREQAHCLLTAGGDPEQVRLYTAIARRAPARHLRDLPRLQTVFDAAAGDYLRRRAVGGRCWDVLTSVLALRHVLQRREPDGSGVSLLLGQTVWLRLADVLGQPFQTVAYVRDRSDQALHLVYPASTASPASIAVGLSLDVIVQQGAEVLRARVRVRGYHADRRGVQLLVDVPGQWLTSSFDLGWRDVFDPVDVVLSERFGQADRGDRASRTQALVVRTCCEGIAVQLPETRLARGEAVRLQDGAHSGLYRTYAELRTPDAVTTFLLRTVETSGANGSVPPASVLDGADSCSQTACLQAESPARGTR